MKTMAKFNKWSKSEIRILKKEYGITPNDQLAKKLNRKRKKANVYSYKLGNCKTVKVLDLIRKSSKIELFRKWKKLDDFKKTKQTKIS